MSDLNRLNALHKREHNILEALEWANGEYAEMLEQDLERVRGEILPEYHPHEGLGKEGE